VPGRAIAAAGLPACRRCTPRAAFARPRATLPRAPGPPARAGRRPAEPHRRPALPPPGMPRHAAGQGPGGRGVAVLPFCHYSFVKCF